MLIGKQYPKKKGFFFSYLGFVHDILQICPCPFPADLRSPMFVSYNSYTILVRFCDHDLLTTCTECDRGLRTTIMVIEDDYFRFLDGLIFLSFTPLLAPFHICSPSPLYTLKIWVLVHLNPYNVSVSNINIVVCMLD